MKRSVGLGVAGWTILVLLLLAAMFAHVGSVAFSMLSGERGLVKVPAPGSQEIVLPSAGWYDIYHEFSRTADSLGELRPGGVEHLQVELHDRQGAEVSLLPPARPKRYVIRRLVGESIFQFEAKEAGSYLLSTQYPSGVDGQEIVLTIKRDWTQQVLTAFLRGVGSVLLILLGMSVVFFILRRRQAAAPVDVEFRI